MAFYNGTTNLSATNDIKLLLFERPWLQKQQHNLKKGKFKPIFYYIANGHYYTTLYRA